MDRARIATDSNATRLRRVGRLARRRMRIDGAELRNGIHTDGTVSIEISGLGSPVAGIPDSFEWEADRPIALVIVRSGIDGENVDFEVGPSTRGVARAAGVGDGTGLRYVAFCYDAPPVATPATVAAAAPASEGPRTLLPSGRERRSILALLLGGAAARRATV
jgi:hypothetical protein